MNFCCLARKYQGGGFQTYRDLSYKDFLITFHPFSIGDFLLQKEPFFRDPLGCAPGSGWGLCSSVSWRVGGNACDASLR